jgi:hypothetical protein
MIQATVLVLVGAAVIVVMVLVLRSGRIRDRVYRGSSGVRSLLRLSAAEPETFDRQFEMGIYFGMCLGAVVALLGVLVAVD